MLSRSFLARCLFAIGLLSHDAVCQQEPLPLRDAQQVILTGRLVFKAAGRLQFAILQTANAYAPILRSASSGQKPAVLHEIGLSGYPSYASLYAHRGQQVTASGTIGTGPASPYYWHNALLKVSSVRTAKGGELLGAPSAPIQVAADTGLYRAGATLPADAAAPWQYHMQGSAEAAAGMLQCGSNGGGDVVNCSCARGFHASEAGMVAGGKSLRGDLMGTAQFSLPESSTRAGEIQLSVTCSR